MSTNIERVLCFSALALLCALGASASAQTPRYGFGARPSQAELDRFFAVMPDGRGLPPGSGSVEQGKALYEQQCAACHGANLQGGIGDKLIGGRGTLVNNDPTKANGVVEVNLKLADLPKDPDPNVPDPFTAGRAEKCQPSTYCSWNGTACVDKSGSDAVCKWAVAAQDCPDGGCFGISFTLPSGFATRAGNDPRPNPRPPAVCLAKAPPWDISPLKVPDDACPQDADNLPADFCQ